MNDSNHQQTKLWFVPELDNLELFRAHAIHHSYNRHSHRGYSIGVIEAGVGGNCHRGSTYLAPPGNIVFMNPEEVHTGYSANDLPLTYRMLYPSVKLIQEISDDLQVFEFPYFRAAVVQDNALAQDICSLHVALEQAIDRLEYQSRFIEVFSVILTRYATSKALIRPNQEHRTVTLIKNYLHDNYSADIALEQLARLTNLNRSYLIRVFHQAVGMPPYTYLNQIRVEKAKQLLAQGDSIADVAIAVGMSDQSHLTRHFKQIVGVTPGRYRESISFKTLLS